MFERERKPAPTFLASRYSANANDPLRHTSQRELWNARFEKTNLVVIADLPVSDRGPTGLGGAGRQLVSDRATKSITGSTK